MALYITEEEYIDRFTTAETVKITDEDGGGTIDGVRLDTAIADASEIVDSYLLARYVLPLPVVPPMIKRLCADLARELLHTNYPTAEVEARADRARADLKMLANGTIYLPIGGIPVETSGSGSPIAASRPEVFNDCALSGYA